jgi:hypothetical protein
MRLSRTSIKLICHALVGVFLFAQLVVSGYACPALAPASALAPSSVVAAQADEVAAMPAGCEQMDPDAANLCAEHCKYGQQGNNAEPSPPALAPVLVELYALPFWADLCEATSIAGTRAHAPAYVAQSPPHAILHCVLRF